MKPTILRALTAASLWCPLLVIGDAFCRTHFTFVEKTGTTMTILVRSAIQPAVNGRPLLPGDEIGVFTPGNLCVGAVEWNGRNAAITVWGDNEQTPVIDGAKSGEKLTFRIWDSKTAAAYDATVSFASGKPLYAADGIAIVSTLAVVRDSDVAAAPVPAALSNATSSKAAVPAVSASLSGTKSDQAVENVRLSAAARPVPSAPLLRQTDSIATAILIEPKDSAAISGDSVILKWQYPKTPVTRCWVELSHDSTMKQGTIDSALSPHDTARTFRLLTSGRYWWRVRLARGDQWDRFSETKTFCKQPHGVEPDDFTVTWRKTDAEGKLWSIEYTLPAASTVKITVGKKRGKPVRTFSKNQPAGYHSIPLDIGNIDKGLYILTIETGTYSLSANLSIK